MSIVYGFVSEKRREEVEGFERILKELNASYMNQLNAYIANHLTMEDAAANVENALRHTVLTLVPEVEEDHHKVCTATSTNIYWRTDNGFTCLGDVIAFAEAHPELSLENEYHEKLSVSDFSKVIKIREGE